MVENYRVVNVIHRLAVMVYNGDVFGALVYLGAFDNVLVVGVNNYQQSVVVHFPESLFRGDEYRQLVGKVFIETVYNGLCKIPFGVNCHVSLYFRIETPYRAAHTRSRANAVKIAVAVSHNDNAGGGIDKLSKSGCDKSGFDLCGLFDPLCDSAEKLKAVFVFDGDLVSASALSHFKSMLRVLFRF